MEILIVRVDGPVLSQTDLYLLNPHLEVNPILQLQNPKFVLSFNLATGMSHFHFDPHSPISAYLKFMGRRL